jgi:DNA (cytosine-5)-methyltransferase 1
MRCVDLFAGWGGFTAGAEQAGARVVWAANHWPLAVQAHAANHPRTRHVCQDLRQADWFALPAYDVLLASPACQGHSQASQPRRRRYHDAMRATAWAVVDCADATEPRAVIVENVPDFTRWRLYPRWRGALEDLGYRVTETVVCATAAGVPQRRRRVIVIGVRGRRGVDLGLAPARTEPAFGPHVQWRAGDWRPVRGATEAARARMRRGRARCGPRFLTQHVTNHPGVPLCEPIRTITTKDQWAVVRGDVYRPLTIRETARAMGFDDAYSWPACTRRETITGLGNAIPPPLARAAIARVAGVL